jgi:hypothetical protein
MPYKKIDFEFGFFAYQLLVYVADMDGIEIDAVVEPYDYERGENGERILDVRIDIDAHFKKIAASDKE